MEQNGFPKYNRILEKPCRTVHLDFEKLVLYVTSVFRYQRELNIFIFEINHGTFLYLYRTLYSPKPFSDFRKKDLLNNRCFGNFRLRKSSISLFLQTGLTNESKALESRQFDLSNRTTSNDS